MGQVFAGAVVTVDVTQDAEQRALSNIATLVATGAQPRAVFHAVAEQVGGLFDGTLGGVVRFDAATGVGEIVGGWSATGTDITGATIDLSGTSAAARVYQTRAPAKIAGRRSRVRADPRRVRVGGAICAPIVVEGDLWGSVGTSFAADTVIPPAAEQRLARFAELVALAIANAYALDKLTHQAATDPLTGLANRRTFHERLRAELERSAR